MNFIHFGLRIEIERLYLEWCAEEGIANKPNSMVVFLMEKGWLNEEKIIEDLKKPKTGPQTNGIGTTSCQECKYFREDMPCRPYIVGLECKYEPKIEPQTKYKEWEVKPAADLPTENTTCVGVAMALVEDDFFRNPTDEERKAVADYIDSISVPTGVNVFDLMDGAADEKEKLK